MAITAQQRQTTARVDLGGDALEALQALRPTAEPRMTVVTVTTDALTLDRLIADARAAEPADRRRILAATRRVTLVPHASGVHVATGGEPAGAESTPMGLRTWEIDGTAASLAGLSFYGENVAMTIIEEG